MSAKRLLDQIQVQSPCTASWDSMVGNDQIRFCQHCNQTVHDISAITRKDVARLIAKSQGRLCVRYQRRPDGSFDTLKTAKTLHQISPRVARLAAGAFSAALSVTGAVILQDGSVLANASPAINKPGQQPSTGKIVGSVRDPNGAMITSATISVSNSQTNLSLFTSTNQIGEYRFEGLVTGIYNLRVEAPGFSAYEQKGFYISEDGEMRLDVSLEIATLEETVEVESGEGGGFVGGVVAFVAPSDPFIRAAQQDNLDEVTKLVAGRDVNLRDKSSHTTALEHAVINANREMIQLLIAAGADVNATNSSGETPLMMLDSDATADLTWDLINAGAKVNTRDKQGNNALMHAASVNNIELLKTLLEAGAQVNDKNKAGATALMLAASDGMVNNVRALLLAGAEINALDKEGKNALYYASDNSQAAVFRLLRGQGAEQLVALEQAKPDH